MKKQNKKNELDNSNQNLASTKTTKKLLPFIGGLSFVSLASLFVVTSVAISSPSMSSSLSNNGNLMFDNKIFKNKEELLEYAQKSYFQGSETVDNRISWSIDEKGQKIYFNDPKLLRKHLSSKIIQTSALSSKNFNQASGGLGEINANDFSSLYFNQTQDKIEKKIYRGKNDSIHTTIESAKDSYLSMHDAYYFNNIYFRNIEELKVYLKTVYYTKDGDGFSNDKTPKNIGLVSPNGRPDNAIISSGMNSNDLFSQIVTEESTQTKKDFMNNISSLANKYIEFKDKDGKYFYAKESDLKNLEKESPLLTAFNNPEYTKLYSNNGKSTYIVDLDKDDENTLFGQYYLQTSGNITQIEDRDAWKKTDRDDPLIAQERNSNIISGLLDMLLFPDSSDVNDKPFNIMYLNKEIIVPFYELLEINNKNVYDKWLDFSKTIKQGKRFNTFFSLPVFYFFLIDNLVKDSASQEMIIQTKKMFNSIAQYLDFAVGLLFPKDLLRNTNPISQYGKYLSFEEIFNFNSNDIDINTSINSFINKISENFSQFIVAINIVSQANLNAMYNGGVLEYRHDFIKKTLGNDQNIVMDDSNHKTLYKSVWDMFSSPNNKEMYNQISPKYKPSLNLNDKEKAFIDDLTLSLSASNSIFTSGAQFLFNEKFKDIEFQSGMISNDKYKLLEDFVIKNDSTSKNIIKSMIEAKKVLTWENFMLIKMLYKADDDKLSKIKHKFSGDQDELKTELLKIVEGLSLNKYTPNFIIDSKITKNLASIASDSNIRGNFITYSEAALGQISKMVDMVKEMVLIFEKSNGNLSQTNAKEILSTIISSPLLKSVSSAIPYLQIGLIALDFLNGALVPAKTYSSYKFELEDGGAFIWNGGQSTTMFFGLAEISSVSIKDMKLMEPQRVVSERNEDYLYFNGKKYSETQLQSLKIDQLRAILNGEFPLGDNIRIVYSFDSISTINETGPSTVRNEKAFAKFGTIDDLTLSSNVLPPDERTLVQYVYKSIYDGMNSNDQTHHGKEYYKDKFIFANGSVANNPNDAVEMLIDEVIGKIQPVKIAMLPTLENNKPKYENNEDVSISEYILPSRSWSGGLFSVNDTPNKYIIFDPNQTDDSGNTFSAGNAEIKVRNLFHEYFDVDYKIVIENEIISNNMFSELSSSIISNVIFQAKLDNNLTKYFFDEVSAFKWLLSEMNFTLYSYSTETEIFKYKDQIFQSRDEFLKFVLDEATVEVK
ncbi:MAG: hypothetical protein ACRC1F_00785 [Metamycoplasmataceae bacterium]